MVTGEQVKAAVMASGITLININSCSICKEWIAYVVNNGNLYFDPSCRCSIAFAADPRTWGSAADLINMQTNETARTRILAGFGMTPDGQSKIPIIPDKVSTTIYYEPPKLTSLEAYNNEKWVVHNKEHTYPKPNGIACPSCEKELSDADSMTLTSYPPQRNIICTSCGFSGYRMA